MGSKTPEGHHRGRNESSVGVAIASGNPPKPAAASGLLEGALEGQDQNGDGDDDDDEKIGADLKSGGQSMGNKKKKRKSSKRKKKYSPDRQQSNPPRVPLADLFPTQRYPEGQIVQYATPNENLQRTTAEELRHLSTIDSMDDAFLTDYRKAAEVHRQVRQYAQTIAQPGISMSQLAQEIEDGVHALTGHAGIEPGDALKAGLAFPTGLCLNNVAAHWTPNPGAKEVVLKEEDVLKVDFGVHVNGRIVDSAFTVAFDPVYEGLLEGVRAATETGLREAGIDARISHLSHSMQEVMESHEITLYNGKTVLPIRAVRSITGHNILRYKIHGDKQVPFYKSNTTQRMEEGDVFAIETFGSTGTGVLRDDGGLGVYGYGRNELVDVGKAGLHHASAKALLKVIDGSFGTLVFSKRDLEHMGVRKYQLGMKSLVKSGVVECYEPLVDVKGSYVAQFEHTILLRPNCKEIISRGDDY